MQTITAQQLDSLTAGIIEKMSLKEKVHEMHGQGAVRMGLAFIFRGHGVPVKAGGSQRLGIPTQLFTDGPRGVTCAKATCFPVTMARSASWDVELEKRVGEAMGIESRAAGANYSGAVCMNVLRHPFWGRAQETYGEDPWLLGEMASALVAGLQKHNVNACLKHFAANSMENNRYAVNIKMDNRTLHEVYLPHFKKCIDRGAMTVMSAYNQLNGEYCGHNKTLLTDILRGQWGFKGYVTSDWESGIYDGEAGIKAGMNVEMSQGVYYSLKNVKRLLRDQKITMQEIDALIYPVIHTKLYFQNRADTLSYTREQIACPAHTALAREVAEKSAVLLKNEKAMLPLNKGAIKKIACIGSLAAAENTGDHGSSWVRPPYIITPLQGIKDYLLGSDVEILTAEVNDTLRIKEICLQADAVIVVAGNNHQDEGEFISMEPKKLRNPEKPEKNIALRLGILGQGGDRSTLALKRGDITAIEMAAHSNPNVAVVLVGGSAISVEEWHTGAAAILQTFYSGMEGGHALAKILFGEVNPGGKLPFTVPKNEADLPAFNSYAREVEYGYYHGYTLLNKKKVEPRFPFGFGLSYTKFAVGNLKVLTPQVKPADTIKISAQVSNTGKVKGAEVVQLYVGFPGSKVDRAEKLLRGFKKVELEPGENTEVTFTLLPEDLAYYDEALQTMKVENLNYEVLVGNSSANLQKAQLTLSGF